MITLQEPNGNEVQEPSLDYLRDRVLDADLAYWDGPAGGAGLFNRDSHRNAHLLLIVQAEGCLVTHRDLATRKDLFLTSPTAADQTVERVEVWDGQNELSIAPRFLVPREDAWAAVTAFVQTAAPSPELHWEDRLDMDEQV